MNRILETLLDAARADAHDDPGRCELRSAVDGLVGAHRRGRLQQRTDRRSTSGSAPTLPSGPTPPSSNGSCPRSSTTPAGTRAARSASRRTAPRTRVLIDISDDGPGVPAEFGEAVFEPGRRVTPDDGHRGAGLGLPLSRRLARSVAGDVTVTGPDSHFRVRLPPA